MYPSPVNPPDVPRFYQVVSTLGPIYRVDLPEEYQRLMGPFDVFGKMDLFNIFLPGECFAGQLQQAKCRHGVYA